LSSHTIEGSLTSHLICDFQSFGLTVNGAVAGLQTCNGTNDSQVQTIQGSVPLKNQSLYDCSMRLNRAECHCYRLIGRRPLVAAPLCSTSNSTPNLKHVCSYNAPESALTYNCAENIPHPSKGRYAVKPRHFLKRQPDANQHLRGDSELTSRMRVSECWTDNTEESYPKEPAGTRLLDDAQPSRKPSLLTGRAAPASGCSSQFGRELSPHHQTVLFGFFSSKRSSAYYCAYSSSSLSFRTRLLLLVPAARPLPCCTSCTEMSVPVRACRANSSATNSHREHSSPSPTRCRPLVSPGAARLIPRAHLSLSLNKRPFAHFSTTAGRAV
jgi:hypothetical protein